MIKFLQLDAFPPVSLSILIRTYSPALTGSHSIRNILWNMNFLIPMDTLLSIISIFQKMLIFYLITSKFKKLIHIYGQYCVCFHSHRLKGSSLHKICTYLSNIHSDSYVREYIRKLITHFRIHISTQNRK